MNMRFVQWKNHLKMGDYSVRLSLVLSYEKKTMKENKSIDLL